MITGYYYLHTNGQLIFKRETDGGTAADIRESPFALALWPVNPEDRETCWRILVEGLAAGADIERVKNLADRWKCTDEDAKVYADRLGIVLASCGAKWVAGFADLNPELIGTGPTALEAMGELCKALGFVPTKMSWGSGFADLIKSQTTAKGPTPERDQPESNLGDFAPPCPECGATGQHYMICSKREE